MMKSCLGNFTAPTWVLCRLSESLGSGAFLDCPLLLSFSESPPAQWWTYKPETVSDDFTTLTFKKQIIIKAERLSIDSFLMSNNILTLSETWASLQNRPPGRQLTAWSWFFVFLWGKTQSAETDKFVLFLRVKADLKMISKLPEWCPHRVQHKLHRAGNFRCFCHTAECFPGLFPFLSVEQMTETQICWLIFAINEECVEITNSHKRFGQYAKRADRCSYLHFLE